MRTQHAFIAILALGIGSLGLTAPAGAQTTTSTTPTAKSSEHQQSATKGQAGRGNDMLSQLGLSADQQTQIKAIREKYQAQMHPTGGQAPARADMQKLRQQENDEISKVLTDEQRTKWEQVKSQHAAGGARHHSRTHGKAGGGTSAGGTGTTAPGSGTSK